MGKFFQFVLFVPLVATLALTPSLAESRPERKPRQDDDGVQQAIAFQRAKDRADAAQARKEARQPEHFTYAPTPQNPPAGLATEQRREALERSEKSADHQPQR
jgi:hypothetical protein